MSSHRLPNGTIGVLLSGEVPEQIVVDAAALLGYLRSHPDIDADQVAEMIFRVRVPRRFRALAMVSGRDDLIDALEAVVAGREHPQVIAASRPATACRIGLVFPGQGSQRPGMGRLFYDSVPAYRTEADRCAAAFQTQFGTSPLPYLLDADLPASVAASTVQPALFTQMAALAAMWRAFGVQPHAVVGHSQGEIAAAFVGGAISLADAVLVVGSRARAADTFSAGDYAMAVIADGRDACEELLARYPDRAEVSVINSPGMTGISGERATVQGVVDLLTERGVFARVIGVAYPAHTSMINALAGDLRHAMQQQLTSAEFLPTDVACLGGTLGGPIPDGIPVDEYWFLNLRNIVRFDKAIAAAQALEIDTFVEIAEHPTLQLAIGENLCNAEELVIGTSLRAATDLDEVTRNLVTLAVHDLNFSWSNLRAGPDGPPALPLPGFPNAPMSQFRLWQPYDSTQPRPTAPPEPVAPSGSARLLVENWVRLARRSLMPPRSIGIVDDTGDCAELAAEVGAAAQQAGATARVIDGAAPGLDTQVILIPPDGATDAETAADRVAAFFGDHQWWHGIDESVTECWLVTEAGEAVVDADAPPNLLHAAASAGFRSAGAQYPGVRFRHLDLPPGMPPAASAAAIIGAVHTREESELALRDGALYAKRVVEPTTASLTPAAPAPEHVLIIGGTGNVGLQFCGHFARAGTKRITLVNRSGENPELMERLRAIRAADTDVSVTVTACDVSDDNAVSALAEALRSEPPNVIIHAAVEYSGAELKDLTVTDVARVLQTKVVGISRILASVPRADDCRVMLCSSISASVGGRGMIVYAAGNRMLDAAAQHFRADGIDCVAVQWGHWAVHSEPTEPAGSDAAQAMLSKLGVIPLQPEDALRVGMTTLPRNYIVAAFDLVRARSVLESCGRAELLAQLTTEAAGATEVTEARTAEQPQPSDSGADLAQRFLTLLADTIGVDGVDTIDKTIPMVAIGLDSLQALEIRRRVKLEFDHDLQVADLLGGASVEGVLARLRAE